jgi:hypothetical protein
MIGLTALPGCGSSRFGSQLKESPRPEQIQRAGYTVHIPADHQFSISLPQSSREPGLTGSATSDATITRQGTASATAEVTDTGQASGMFQLGHSFANETGEQADFQFTIRLTYSYFAAASPATAFPDARIGLKLYARNNRGQLLRDLTFLVHSTENGPTQGVATESSQFTLTLAPSEAVDVFLAGQAVVDIREHRSASGRVNVDKLEMDVAIRSAQGTGSAPAPATVPTQQP